MKFPQIGYYEAASQLAKGIDYWLSEHHSPKRQKYRRGIEGVNLLQFKKIKQFNVRDCCLLSETVVYCQRVLFIVRDYLEADYCLQRHRVLYLRKQTFVYEEAVCCLQGSRLLFNDTFYLLVGMLVVFETVKAKYQLALLLHECHSSTSFFLQWQQQKTKVFQSHV